MSKSWTNILLITSLSLRLSTSSPLHLREKKGIKQVNDQALKYDHLMNDSKMYDQFHP